MDINTLLDSGVLVALISGVVTLLTQSRKSRNAICEKLESVEKKTDMNSEEIQELKFESCKAQILNFANAIMNGKQYSKEQFSHILQVVDLYETIYADKHNGEMKQSVAFIKDEHAAMLRARRKSVASNKGA